MSILKETVDITKDFSKLLENLNIGRSFRVFGGVGLLIAFWSNNNLVLGIALITFIFGAISKVIEMFNKAIDIALPNNERKNRIISLVLQSILWIIFITAYSLVIFNLWPLGRKYLFG